MFLIDRIDSPLIYSFVSLVGLELILLIMGARWYYRFGLPLFRQTFHVRRLPDLQPEMLKASFEKSFQDALVFIPISEDEIGFREDYRLFDTKIRWSKYAPLMRGMIRIDRRANRVRITCYPHWFILFFYAILCRMVIMDWPSFSDHWNTMILIIGIVLLTGLIQYYRFTCLCYFMKTADARWAP